MKIAMIEQDLDNASNFLHIKELKEKVRSLVSEVDLNRGNAKFKHEKNFDNNLSSSVSSDENDDEFIDCSDIELRDETNWLTGEDDGNVGSMKEICRLVYSDIDDNRPDITGLCMRLESSSAFDANVFAHPKAFIDSRTFTRPKKCSARPPLSSVVNAEEERPKLQRRLTTTIAPTPNLISKLEELSRSNNRPVSGNYGDVKWEDGSQESMAEVRKPMPRSKRQSLPASLFDRLQELKRANSNFKVPNVVTEQAVASGGRGQNLERGDMLEDAKKVTAALDTDVNNRHGSRLSEIFRNTQEYYSDDNESFISLDEVSGFCDRLTLSTDQNTYSSIVREMEQHEICLFHRTPAEDKSNRMTFGGTEIPAGNFPKNVTSSRSTEDDEENDLNRTYEIDDEESDNKMSNTFEVKKNVTKNNIMNATYDANRKPGLVDVILQSDVIKNLSPNACRRSSSDNVNGNNNDNSNNNKTTTTCEAMNYTYEKRNGTLDRNELNALQTEKYSTKVFDSSYRKSEPEAVKSAKAKADGKKDQSDQSEDDCTSTTSDNSCRSFDSNSETKTSEEANNVKLNQKKKFASTPITGQTKKLDFDVVSPIRMDAAGMGESYSNPSSRGHSPKRMVAVPHQPEGTQKHRMPNLRQPLKVPQRELKLKTTANRPTQNFKRPSLYPRTSSEPSVPQKVESFQPAASATSLRPSGPSAVPSLTNVRPSSRISGIPRPPTRLKQPQIRVSYSKK